MREIFVGLLEQGLEYYPESSKNHVPNTVTKKAIDNAQQRKGLKKAATVEELFKKLG